MSSAIRFSRSQSQDSQAAATASNNGNEAITSGRASQSSHHRRDNTTAAAGAAEVSEVFQELPSSIPSASSHPPSQRTKATTTTTNSSSGKSGSGSRSHSRRSISQPAPDVAGGEGYPWGFYYPPPPFFPVAAAPPPPPPVPATGEEDDPKSRSEERPRSGYPPGPRTGTFPFAVPNIPWIPPPPLHGAPAPDLASAYAAQYFASLAAAEQRHPFDVTKKPTKATKAVRGAANAAPMPPTMRPPYYGYAGDEEENGERSRVHRIPCAAIHASSSARDADWPTPDQLPLPSSFPMPPRLFPPVYPTPQQGSRSFDVFPPPPLPPWWFLQAMGIPSIRDANSSSSSSSSNSSDSSPSSRTSSPYTPPPRQDAPRPSLQRRFVPPAGSVETPTPVPRGSASSATTTMTTTTSASTIHNGVRGGTTYAAAGRAGQAKKTGPATASANAAVAPSARPVRRRALSSSESSEGNSTHHVVKDFSRRPRTTADATEQAVMTREEMNGEEELVEEERRMKHVLSTAESYLTRIEDLYHRLRHRYEEVLLSPVKAVESRADAASTHGFPTTQGTHFREDDEEPYGDTASQQQRYAVAPTRAPSRTPSPALPHIASPTVPPYHSSASPRPTTSASQSVREELATLESQWQRLEELKQHGVGAGDARTSSYAEPQRFSSTSFSTTTGKDATAATAPSRSGDVFNNQSVMELINDRKHLLASAA